MTWSIIARDEATGAFGIAAASRFFALGALVPWIKSGVGAVATQAMVNPRLGPTILEAWTTVNRWMLPWRHLGFRILMAPYARYMCLMRMTIVLLTQAMTA